jgi:hypothetical protein
MEEELKQIAGNIHSLAAKGIAKSKINDVLTAEAFREIEENAMILKQRLENRK